MITSNLLVEGDRGFLSIIPNQQASHINVGDFIYLKGNVYSVSKRIHDLQENKLTIILKYEGATR